MAHAIPIGLAVAAGALSAGGTILGAKNESKALRAEADQLEVQAGSRRASAQREAMEQRRQARLLQSRQLAVAAASGGGADDPTVVNLMADAEGEGAYRGLVALYEGEEEARSLEAQARARRKEGKNVKQASYLKAGSQILGAGASMFGRYG